MGVKVFESRTAPLRDGTCADDCAGCECAPPPPCDEAPLADECRRLSRRRGVVLVSLVIVAGSASVWLAAGFVAGAVTAVCLAATLPWSRS